MQTSPRPVAAILATTLLAAAAAVGSAAASDLRDPEADALLKRMSDYLADLPAFTADVFIEDQRIMGDGFKLSALLNGSVAVQRPDRMHLSRKGAVRDQEVFFDGERVVVVGNAIGRYVDIPVEGGLENALDVVTEALGAELPGRDLLSDDPYTALIEPVNESAYLGTAEIHGMTCRQLAFRTDEVDWQLWVQEGDEPVPCRYSITSKWTYGAPQYSVTLAHWELAPDIPEARFRFSAPEGAEAVTLKAFHSLLDDAENQ